MTTHRTRHTTGRRSSNGRGKHEVKVEPAAYVITIPKTRFRRAELEKPKRKEKELSFITGRECPTCQGHCATLRREFRATAFYNVEGKLLCDECCPFKDTLVSNLMFEFLLREDPLVVGMMLGELSNWS